MTKKNKQNKKQANNETFNVTKHDKYRTAEDLIERSTPSVQYYVLLVLSSIIISAGLLLNNTAIVIGGMLVTPLLTPILVIALGMSVGELPLISRTAKFVGYSLLFVVASGIILTLVFQAPAKFTVIENSIRTGVLYFIVAIAAGIAGTFAWVRKETAEALPGVAIAVSLVPPLALVGIGIGVFDWNLVSFYIVLFALNLFGTLLGSLIVFNLTKFHSINKKIKRKNEEVVVEQHLQKLGNEEKE